MRGCLGLLSLSVMRMLPIPHCPPRNWRVSFVVADDLAVQVHNTARCDRAQPSATFIGRSKRKACCFGNIKRQG